MSPEPGPSLFLSYARADDEPFVERLWHDLEARGIRVWWDQQSMSSRGLTFLDEIQRAIESVDRVVAVIGPGAVTSDYVLYEWEYALLFGKAVVPILRLGDHDSIPGHLTRDLRRDHCPDFRAERPYPEALDELERIVREPVALFGPLRATPALPRSFLPRRAALEAMRRTLYADLERPRPVASSADQTLVLHGMAGSGKSVLAAAFARSIETRRAAGDGIAWLKAGRDARSADRLANLRLLGVTFGDDARHYTDENAARSRLPGVIAERSCLIVLDDAWRTEDAEPYLNALGPRCRLLVTTRDAGLGALGNPLAVEELNDAEALTLLARSSGQAAESLPATATEVARACGKLPLALAMIGAMVHGNPDRWAHALHRLQTVRLDRIRFGLANYDYEDLDLAIHVSVEDLTADERARYLELAVFPSGAAIPEATLRVLWELAGVDRYDATDLVDLFVRRSLARRVTRDGIALHDLQCAYLRGRTPDLPALDGRLVDAYARHCPDGWPSGPDDGYFFQFLSHHLRSAGRTPALRELLLDYRWLNAKLRATSIVDLIADYGALDGDAETRLVEQALQLAAGALAADRTQLRGQLHARLLPFAGRPGGARGGGQACRGPWMRLLAPSLTAPGGPLIRTLAGHTGFVDAVVLFDQGRHALSASHDRTVRVWDVERGVEVLKLPDETFAISRVAVTGDGALAVTAASDYTLRVWDLRQGRELRRLSLSQSNAHALVLVPSDRVAVAGLQDHSIQIWDLESGTRMATLRGHDDGVCALAITPDGHTLVSGDYHGAIGFWALAERRLIRMVPAHARRIIALLCDSEDVASASSDGSVKVWKIATGEQAGGLSGCAVYDYATTPMALCADGSRMVLGGAGGEIAVWDFAKGEAWTLAEGHTAWVTSIQVFPDSRRAISASGDCTIKIWSLDPPAQARRPAHAYFVTDVVVTPDGQRALSVSPRDGVKVWDLSTLELVRSVPAPRPDRVAVMKAQAGLSMQAGDVLAAALFRDGRRCAWALQDESVRVTDLETARELARLDLRGVDAVNVTPDGRQVVCVAGADIVVWDWAAARVISTRAIGGRYYWVAVSPDGSRLVTSAWFGDTIDVREMLTAERLYAYAGHRGSINAIAFSPDGGVAYSASHDQTIRAWDVVSGNHRMVFEGHRGAVHAVAASPDGTRLVSGAEDCTLRVWDARNSSSIAALTGDAPFRACTVAPDGRIVAGDSLGRVHFVSLCP